MDTTAPATGWPSVSVTWPAKRPASRGSVTSRVVTWPRSTAAVKAVVTYPSLANSRLYSPGGKSSAYAPSALVATSMPVPAARTVTPASAAPSSSVTVPRSVRSPKAMATSTWDAWPGKTWMSRCSAK